MYIGVHVLVCMYLCACVHGPVTGIHVCMCTYVHCAQDRVGCVCGCVCMCAWMCCA
jgi:hypothetical protein